MRDEFQPNDPDLVGAGEILKVLQGLRDTAAGDALYLQISAILDQHNRQRLEVERGYASALASLLGAWAQRLPNGAPLRVHLNVLQARLEPPLSSAVAQVLRRYIDDPETGGRDAEALDAAALQTSLAPLLARFGVVVPEVAAAPTGGLDDGTGASTDDDPETGAGANDEVSGVAGNPGGGESRAEAMAASSGETDGAPVAAVAPWQVLGSDVAAPPAFVEGNATADGAGDAGAVALAARADRLAAGLHEMLADNGDGDAAGLRQALAESVEALRSTHAALANRLSDETPVAAAAGVRGRLRQLTDDKTGLPGCRAFLRRYEDELSRAQRYGLPVSLALLAVAGVEDYRARYGDTVTQAVLHRFTERLLGLLRRYDTVALHGGSEFAVLMPNTDEDGASQILDAVRALLRETRCEVDRVSLQMPEFVAGVAQFTPGERGGTLLRRADHALADAMEQGADAPNAAKAGAGIIG